MNWLEGYLLIACLTGMPCQEVQEIYPVQDQKGSGVRLTRPDGSDVYVNPRMIASLAASPDGGTIISFSSGGRQEVLETAEQVIHAIELDDPAGAWIKPKIEGQ